MVELRESPVTSLRVYLGVFPAVKRSHPLAYLASLSGERRGRGKVAWFTMFNAYVFGVVHKDNWVGSISLISARNIPIRQKI